LLDALDGLSSRLTVGMQFDAFTAAVGDAQVAYDALARANPDCAAGAMAPAKTALDAYAKAQGYWANCVAGKCTVESVKPVLQQKWKDASDALSTIPR
jgi:hypothetical protein